ncbi:hypothetical protein [Rhizobium leguminosarum]|uniref:Uncharacterized protein n=1 Tax=Rhizobium leguminosarum TaxID=384 RepID=A0A6P0BIV8_RHILE|nr:hypothetical protein [Rhizobium leguminosarum]MBY5438024.1 hypothetical protein [Rhizobium leguminosarum]NEI37912.1 hypothetical protein [Rhizobium leguminosarum]NEI44619.1 hypothetical protein [Rhizobium leguminosarum]
MGQYFDQAYDSPRKNVSLARQCILAERERCLKNLQFFCAGERIHLVDSWFWSFRIAAPIFRNAISWAADAIAARKPGREMMEMSRSISFTILALTVFAAGALLLEHTGFFAGAFRTEILARVDGAQNISASDKASPR